MIITLMHYSIPPIVGGVESVLAHQARLMAPDGHDVHIVAARGESWTDAIIFHCAPLVDSRHAEVLAVKEELDRGEKTARFDALHEGAIEQIRPLLADSDVVIAHNICSLAKNLALTAALAELHQTPGFPRLILWHHDLAWTPLRYRSELYDGHPWNLLRSQWPGAVHVVVSQLRRRELAELIDIALDDIAVVPNGVDPAAFYKFDATTADLLAQIGIMNSAPILLLPVRLTRRKNIEFALHVLAALRRRMPAAALVVTGPLGAHNPTNIRYQEELTALRTKLLLQDSAIFLAEWSDAFLPDSVIADFYRLADVLFMPSFEEGFGIPLIEAALSRTPIFCSEIEPLTELGRDDVTYFDPQGDPEAVAMQVATTLAQSRTYRFAAHARSAFTWEQVYTHHIAPLLVGTSSKWRSE